MFAIVSPPAPALVAPVEPVLSKNQRRKQRQREMANLDPDGDVLPIQVPASAYARYRTTLYQRDKRCVYCGMDLLSESAATLDHQVPRCRGGLNQPWNLWLSCKTCNSAKGNRTALEWLDDLARACQTMGLVGAGEMIFVEVDDPEDEEAAAFHAAFEASMEIGGVA